MRRRRRDLSASVLGLQPGADGCYGQATLTTGERTGARPLGCRNIGFDCGPGKSQRPPRLPRSCSLKAALLSRGGGGKIRLLQPRTLLSGLVVILALHPGALWACAACAGQSDSPMAKGMNWGIFSLLAVVAMVLGGVTSFFVFLAKKSAAVSAASVAAAMVESTDRA
jgi:hypothetical protein